MASGAPRGMNVNTREIKDYLWDCTPENMPFNFNLLGVTYRVEIANMSDKQIHATNLAIVKQYFNLESFIENITRLVVIYDSNRGPICMFTLKLIPDCPIVELFDFLKAYAFREQRGIAIPLLVAFLDEIKKHNPTSVRKIWAGVHERGGGGVKNARLLTEYMRNGFHLLQDPLQSAVIAANFEHNTVPNIDQLTQGFQGISRAKVEDELSKRLILTEISLHQLLESRFGISQERFAKTPLGTISGQPFWSIVYDLSENFVPSPKGFFNISFINLKVESKVLERQLKLGNIIQIQISFRSGEFRSVIDHVMKGPQELSVVIANSPHGRESDTELTWKPLGIYNTTLDIGCSEMPSTSDAVLLVTSVLYISNHITGHTHPARLYALLTAIRFIQSNGKRSLEQSIQDLSGPSFQDFNLILKNKSPGHIIYTVECIYSVVINPIVLSLDQAEYNKIINAVLEQLAGGFSNLSNFFNKYVENLQEPLNSKSDAFLKQRLIELGVMAPDAVKPPKLPERIIRVLRAEFIVKEMNELLTLRPDGQDPIEVALVTMHCYPQHDGDSITPALTFYLDRPSLVLNTSKTIGMCGIMHETKASQKQLLKQAKEHLQIIEEEYGSASAIGFAKYLVSTHNKKETITKQQLNTTKKEHEKGTTANGNIIMNTDAITRRLNELIKRTAEIEKAIKGSKNTNIIVFKKAAFSTIDKGEISSLNDINSLTEKMIENGILTKFEINEVENWAAATVAQQTAAAAIAAEQTAAAAGGPDQGQGGGSLKRTSRKKISHHSRNKRKNRRASRKYKNL